MRTSTVQPELGTTLNRSHPLSKGLVGFWAFTERGGMILRDSSPFNNNGSMTGFGLSGTTSNWRPSHKGIHLDFAATDKAVIPHKSSLDFTTFSCSFWFNTTSTLNGYLVSKNYTSTGGMWAIYLNQPTGGLYTLWLYVQTNASNWIQKGSNTAGGSQNDGKWHHCVATRDTANNMTMYIDSVPLTLASQGAGSVTTITNTDDLEFGHNSVAANKFVGKMTAISLYNRVLTASEARQLYTNPYQMFKDSGRYKMPSQIPNAFKFNNSGVRPRPFAPGHAR